MTVIRVQIALVLAVVLTAGTAVAAGGREVQARVDSDIAEGKPVVVHVTVALCDNVNQGIVPVPKALGNGQDPATNLYWGALYGVRTYLTRSAGWGRLHLERPAGKPILERIVLYREVERNGRVVPVYIVADAWDGARIREAILAYLEMVAGRSTEKIPARQKDETVILEAGGASHLVVYVGHNGLMDFPLRMPKATVPGPPARSAVVLACASKVYFLEHLQRRGAHPLLLTTGLIAPEAYTLDAAIRSWVTDGTTAAVLARSAEAYDRYQRCGIPAARRLFWGQP